MPQARTIDEVVGRLEGIIDHCIRTGSRLGYFAALYNRVTQRVKLGIDNGEFDDGPRMERLDVTFANRYLAAYDQLRAGEVPSRSWLLAFDAAAGDGHAVVQHLMAGMNAHINLDLGVAAARTCPGGELAGLAGDFDRINDILATLTPVVEKELDETSFDFDALASLAPRLELRIVGVAMREARAAAWSLAKHLAPLPIERQLRPMATRDDEAVGLGLAVLAPGPLVSFIRRTESPDVAHNIRILASGEFKHPAVPAHLVDGAPAA
ncbi:MAG: hypothetical protein JWM27_4585 [Gemmatimonadetes bacterium]|nr:hypothetical protein [Gemmatimonadota bacterium]